MLAGLHRRVVSLPRRARNHAPDAGFTLTEVLVSMMLIGVVMGALTTFYVNSMSVMNHQRGKQTAVQLAADGIELVRAFKAADLVDGRTQCNPATPCPAPIVGVDLSDMQEWDHPQAAATPKLPIAEPVTRGIPYNRYWYVGKCWQPVGGGPCTRTPDAVEYVRVVVAVTWSDKNCQNSACSYATSTLLSGGTDPLFNPGSTTSPITVAVRDVQPGEVDVPVSAPTITASGGAQPLTFSAIGLPPGLSMNSNGVISGKPTTDRVFTVTATATDDLDNTGSTWFSWTIVPLPQLASPGTQSTPKGVLVTVDLRPQLTGGTGPFTWSVKPGPWGATGLPPGLSISPSGVISGTPTQTGPVKNVTVIATDVNGKPAPVTFGWTVVPRITSFAADRTDWRFMPVLGWATADGTGPYTWTATNLPEGVIMTSGGLLLGDLVYGTRYVTTVTVTDGTGATNSVTFSWRVNSSLGPIFLGPQITAPTGDRTDRVGQTVNVPFSAVGRGGRQTWTATGLPPGVTMTNGVLTGTPSQAGTYLVTLEVRESYLFVLEDRAKFQFTWTIQ
jgi:prepilin-type N-terminal cleavage/methylation domain-containing protein